MTSLSRWLWIVLAATLAVGCGGGGSSGGDEPPGDDTPGDGGGDGAGDPGDDPGDGEPGIASERIATVRYDLDNNGVFEGVRQFSYDTEGRLVREQYTYTDDGEEDADFVSFSLSSDDDANSVLEYSYGTDGRLETIRQTQADGRYIDTTYDWNDDGWLNTSTQMIYSAAGALQFATQQHLEHNGSRLVKVEEYLPNEPDPESTITFFYDGSDPLPVASEDSRSDVRTDITWTGFGKPDAFARSGLNSDLTSSTDLIYDARERLVERRFTSSFNPSVNFYTWFFEYSGDQDRPSVQLIDMQSDGTIEARLEFETETAICQQVVAFLWGAESAEEPDELAPYVPGTGYVHISQCVE